MFDDFSFRFQQSQNTSNFNSSKKEIQRLIEFDKERIKNEEMFEKRMMKSEEAVKQKQKNIEVLKKKMEEKFDKQKEKVKKLEAERRKYQKQLQIKMNNDIQEAVKKEKEIKQKQKEYYQKRELEAENKRQTIRNILMQKEDEEVKLSMERLNKIHQRFEQSSKIFADQIAEKQSKARAETTKVQERLNSRQNQDLTYKMVDIIQRQEEAMKRKEIKLKEIQKSCVKQKQQEEIKKQNAEVKRKEEKIQDAMKRKEIIEKLSTQNATLENKNEEWNKELILRQEKRRLKQLVKERASQRAKRLDVIYKYRKLENKKSFKKQNKTKKESNLSENPKKNKPIEIELRTQTQCWKKKKFKVQSRQLPKLQILRLLNSNNLYRKLKKLQIDHFDLDEELLDGDTEKKAKEKEGEKK